MRYVKRSVLMGEIVKNVKRSVLTGEILSMITMSDSLHPLKIMGSHC